MCMIYHCYNSKTFTCSSKVTLPNIRKDLVNVTFPPSVQYLNDSLSKHSKTVIGLNTIRINNISSQVCSFSFADSGLPFRELPLWALQDIVTHGIRSVLSGRWGRPKDNRMCSRHCPSLLFFSVITTQRFQRKVFTFANPKVIVFM